MDPVRALARFIAATSIASCAPAQDRSATYQPFRWREGCTAVCYLQSHGLAGSTQVHLARSARMLRHFGGRDSRKIRIARPARLRHWSREFHELFASALFIFRPTSISAPHFRFFSEFQTAYLSFDHNSAVFAKGVGREIRETAGARIFKHTSPGGDYDP
jgi:hypothetical protein